LVHDRPVEVVGAAGEPDVVDDADLGVHVDRHAVRVLEVEEGDAVRGDPLQQRHGADLTEPVRRPGHPPVGVRVARTTAISRS
jgi:hypothetical protein